MKKGKRLVFVDYIKSLSMLYIVGYWHLLGYTDFSPGHKSLVAQGFADIVLGLFVLVSGFLTGKSAIRSASAVEFYVKRLVRIYPLYMLAIIIFYFYGLNDGVTSLKSLLLISMVYKPAPLTLWFIAMIMVFYLITPLLSQLTRKPRQYFTISILLIAVLLVWSIYFGITDIRLVIYFPCYCAGIYAARYGIENHLANARNSLALTTLWVVSSFLDIGDWTMTGNLRRLIFVLSFSYFIFLISYKKRNAFIKLRLISFLSYSSYTMYLFHRPIYETFKSFYFPDSSISQALYLVILGIPMIALLTYSVQWLYDTCYLKDSYRLQSQVFTGHRQKK